MSVSEDGLVARAEALLPALAAREAETARDREVPRETVAAYHEAGLLRALQPRAFGGAQLGFRAFSRTVETLARACASSAWVYAVLAEHQWVIGSFPEQAQRDVWGENPRAVASSSLSPRNIARVVPGGYELSGDFPFSSGSRHAPWAILGANRGDRSGPTHYHLVPMDQLQRVDDWHVLGLRGTGSQTLRADRIYVPAHRTVALADLRAGTTPGAAVWRDDPLLRAPRDYLVPFSLPPVGFALARRSQGIVLPALRARRANTQAPQMGAETAEIAVAEACSEIDAAHLVMHTARDVACGAVDAGTPITQEMLLTARRDVGFAQRLIRNAVQRLCDTLGSHIVYDSSALQAILRDVLTIGTHRVWSWDAVMLPYGQWRLGNGGKGPPP
jgi:3-hydroxy-9,10-secoandrosta-1,3,5(10)-triene-9,17-dione monooxygenase